ncbi:MAG: hypothetical protein HYX48_04135 [Chlamydiales bacterium]|nr:hypothetical protein [Chlamydiales bacterium]
MHIPPVSSGRAPAFGPGGFGPQQELRALVETVEQIHTQMAHNSGNRTLMDTLQEEYQHTLSQIHKFLIRLPSSQQDVFKGHLEALKGHMHTFYSQLMEGSGEEETHTSSVAVTTNLALLQQDLGFTQIRSSLY